ncbi:MAG: DoxX family membrane protein, partial [Methylibium sp.]|nr:DoxX family membrane protein [Methylibium sp.]
MTPTWLHLPVAASRLATRALEALQPAALLAARVYIGAAFFRSGLTKLADWETTLLLFENEYAVPLLPHELAAVLGT